MILLLTMGYNDISSVNSLTDEIKRDIFEEYTSKILPILN